MKKIIFTTIVLLSLFSLVSFISSDKKKWYTWLEKNGKNSDPKKVFTFEGNSIHVSGEEFGYLCTEKNTAISNSHLNSNGEQKGMRQGKMKKGMLVFYI